VASQTSQITGGATLKKPSQRSQKVSTSSKAAADSWQVQTAKAQFSEVFRRTRAEGPQRITRQGKEAVVMIAEEQYDRLVGKSRRPKNIVDFFRQSPLMGLELDLKRDRSPARDIDL
jgi:prevent-host-death family protein